MTNRFSVSAAVLVALVGGVAASANAEVIATMSYDDLAGGYAQSSPTTGVFTAVAVNTGTLQSSYEASRLIPGAGSASFEAGFQSNPFNPADFVISMNVVRINASLATGTGTFTATDRDGDTITGTISGNWVPVGSLFIAFNGNLGNVSFNDNGAADGTFDGTEGGDFALAFNAAQPFVGSMTQLITRQGAGFFTGNFSDKATGGAMQIIPSPGSMALIGLGGLMVAGRRRSR
jgi:hypothetical protein